MRDLFHSLTDASGSSSTTDSNKVKLQRLSTRVAADYARAEEWSTQKRILAKDLWRKIYSHCDHLQQDLDRIHPDLVASVMSGVPKAPEVVPRAELPSIIMDVGLGDLEDANDTKTKRKRASHPVQTSASGRHSPSFSKQDRPSVTSSRQTPSQEDEVAASKDRVNGSLGEHEEERDENLYCFCQRGSFGEMIGCDSDDCKYEWFHIGCVGVSKPLPQTWLCSDCLAKNKRRRR